MPWPWQCAHGGCLCLCFLLMGTTLALAAGLSHGHHTHACYLDLGCFPMVVSLPLEHVRGPAMALATFPQGLPWPWLLACWRVIFPNEGFYIIECFFFSKEVIWVGQHALALAMCPQGLPWPLLLTYGNYLGFSGGP